MGIVNSNLLKNRKCLKQCKFNGAENQAGYFYFGESWTKTFFIYCRIYMFNQSRFIKNIKTFEKYD